MGRLKTAIELISSERFEQIEKHGYTKDWDIGYENYELSKAAVLLIYNPEEASPLDVFGKIALPNWNQELLVKMDRKTYKERLIIAAALLAAEIDRIQEKEVFNG